MLEVEPTTENLNAEKPNNFPIQESNLDICPRFDSYSTTPGSMVANINTTTKKYYYLFIVNNFYTHKGRRFELLN